MKRLSFFCFVVSLILVFCINIFGVPAKFKKDLKEPRKIISKCSTKVYYRRDYDVLEDLDKAEQMLKDVAKKAGVTVKDSDIRRLLKKIDKIKEQIDKEAKREKRKLEKEKERNKTSRSRRSNSRSSKGDSSQEKSSGESPYDKVFNEVKDDLVAIYPIINKVYNKAYNIRDDEAFANYIVGYKDLITRGENVLQKLNDGIPSLGKFMSKNQEAKKMKLTSKVSRLNLYVPKLSKRVKGLHNNLLNQLESTLTSIKYFDKISVLMSEYNHVKKQFEILDKFFPNDSEVDAAKKKILPKIKTALDKFKGKVDKARMAQDKFNGDDNADELKATMKKLYEAKYPNDKVKRIVITNEDWIEQAKATVNNDDKIVAGVYKDIFAQVAVKTKNGCTVYSIGYRKTWTGKGDEFGPVELHSIGDNYPISEKNINK